MTTLRSPANPETHFGRGAWATLGLALLLLCGGIAVLAYRFTLPTDGWQADFDREVDGFIYGENLMGAPSGLRPGDVVVSVAGFRATDLIPPAQLQAGWQAGASVTYAVKRDGVEAAVPVTLTHWRFGTWLLATLRQPAGLGGLLASYLLLGISAFVFWRRPGNPAAGAFLLLTTTLTFSDLLSGTLASGWPEMIDPLMIVVNGPQANSLLYAVLMPFVLIRFALVFPRPKPILRRWPWLTAAAGLIGLALSLIPGIYPWGWFWFVASLLLMVLILAHTAFTARDAVGRAQVLWGLSGLIFGFSLLTGMLAASTFGLTGVISATAFDVGGAVAYTVMGLMLGIAITRYHLFDIDVIIRRTLIYSVLTALLALTYFGSVLAMQGLLRGVTRDDSPVVIVLSTLLIAAMAAPLRARVQRGIDRRFYRRKYDAARTLANFATTARDEVDLDRLSARLVDVVKDTMQPEHASLWIRQAGWAERRPR
jgi:hypothetical protein